MIPAISENKYSWQEISRQRRYQLKKKKAGLCVQCGKKRVTAFHCIECAAKHRTNARNQYRKRHNIPLDAPLYKTGRPRL